MWTRQTGFCEPRDCRNALCQPLELGPGSSVLAESYPARRPPLIPIEVVQAVHFILVVQGKALVPNAPGTGNACETGRMEGPAQGSDDVLLDHLATLATLLQGVLGQRDTASEPSHGCARSKQQGVSSWQPTGA